MTTARIVRVYERCYNMCLLTLDCCLKPTEEVNRLKKQLVESQTQLDDIREVSLMHNLCDFTEVYCPTE